MLTSGQRLMVLTRRRKRLRWMVVPSLALHLVIWLLLLIILPEPTLPPGGGSPASVEIMADEGSVEGEKLPTPSPPASAVPTEAVPTEALPPAPMQPPAPDVPPPTLETQVQLPPTPSPPPPPPDQTEVAALEPPPPEPTPPPQEAPPEPQAPAVQPPPPRRSSAPAAPPSRTTREPNQTASGHGAREPSPGPGAANPAAGPQSAEGPDTSLRVEGADLPPDWIKQLQAWWDLHAYYPKEASENNEGGTVKVHIVVHQDGQVFRVLVVQGSGSHILDQAGFYIFHNAWLRPFPPGTPAPEADVYISMHFVLTHGHALPTRPFTVTNEPVKGTVVETMQQRTCTGIEVVAGTGRPGSWTGRRNRVTAIFFRKPDRTSWVNWWAEGGVHFVEPVTELGVSAQWVVPWVGVRPLDRGVNHYDVWPAGDNRLSGSVIGAQGSLGADGAINLTCTSKPSGQTGQ